MKKILIKFGVIFYDAAGPNVNFITSLSIQNLKLTDVPPVLFNCPKIEKIDLSNNEIDFVPAGLASLPNLTSLKLDGNPLRVMTNPNATTNPNEKERDLPWLRDVFEKKEKWCDVKIVVVGDGGVQDWFLRGFVGRIKGISKESNGSFMESVLQVCVCVYVDV